MTTEGECCATQLRKPAASHAMSPRTLDSIISEALTMDNGGDIEGQQGRSSDSNTDEHDER